MGVVVDGALDVSDKQAASLTGLWNMMGMLDGFPGTCMNGAWSAQWVEP